MKKNIDNIIPKTVYISSESHTNKSNNDTYQVKMTYCLNSESISNNYQTISESETNLTTNKVNLNSQNSNNSKIPALLSQYIKIFSKSKYDTDKIRIELQKIHLTSELPIFLHAYRIPPKEETEIGGLI